MSQQGTTHIKGVYFHQAVMGTSSHTASLDLEFHLQMAAKWSIYKSDGLCFY